MRRLLGSHLARGHHRGFALGFFVRLVFSFAGGLVLARLILLILLVLLVLGLGLIGLLLVWLFLLTGLLRLLVLRPRILVLL